MKHSVVKCSVMCSVVKSRAVKGEIGAQWCAKPMEKVFRN